MTSVVAWLAWALVLGCGRPARAELFTASSDLQTAFALERSVVPVISNFIARTEEKLSKLKSYLREYGEVESDLYRYEGDNFLEKIAGNPVHAFHLAKRFAVDWRRIQDIMRKDQWSDVAKEIDSLKLGSRLPKESDMLGVAKALVRLHDTYNIDLDRLASGDMLGIQTSATLTAQDCLYMGKHSYNQGMFSRAVEWFDTALRLAEEERNRTVTLQQIEPFAQMARAAHDEVARTPNHTNVHVLHEPLNGRSPAEVRRQQEESGRHHFRLGYNISNEQDFINYKALCRGEQLLHPKEVARLKCWNSYQGHAYFTLRPLKVELKHIDPPLVVFHDVILDEEMETIKNICTEELSRSMVIGGERGDKVSDSRISQTAWLDDSRHPTVARLSRRVAAITGFVTDVARGEAEMFQIVNYGIGGHYNYHEDFLYKEATIHKFEHTPDYKDSGDRIATFMFYLSDVARGGATAFPKLGVSVFPERGAAAFWYNLRRNGRGDVRTLHGGCPVAYGAKWIANKWIRERAQFRRRPCALNPAL